MLYKNGIFIGIVMALLVVIMATTNPGDFSAPLFAIVFALIYALLASSILFVLEVLRIFKVLRQSSRSLVKSSLLLAILPVFLLLLHSIGQLTPRDILLAIAFFGILYAYFGRISPKTRF